MHISASVVAPGSTCSPSPHFQKTLFGSRSGSVRAVSGARRPIGWPKPSPDRIHFGKLGNPPTAGRWRCFSSPARRSAHITLPAAPDLDPCHTRHSEDRPSHPRQGEIVSGVPSKLSQRPQGCSSLLSSSAWPLSFRARVQQPSTRQTHSSYRRTSVPSRDSIRPQQSAIGSVRQSISSPRLLAKNCTHEVPGIRYGRATNGTRRFRPPQRSEILSLDSPFNASAFSPTCPNVGIAAGYNTTYDEDCLSLNIWSPAQDRLNSSSTGATVMIWIYGVSRDHENHLLLLDPLLTASSRADSSRAVPRCRCTMATTLSVTKRTSSSSPSTTVSPSTASQPAVVPVHTT